MPPCFHNLQFPARISSAVECCVPYFCLNLILLKSTEFKFSRFCNMISSIQSLNHYGASDWLEVSTPNCLRFKSIGFG